MLYKQNFWIRIDNRIPNYTYNKIIICYRQLILHTCSYLHVQLFSHLLPNNFNSKKKRAHPFCCRHKKIKTTRTKLDWAAKNSTSVDDDFNFFSGVKHLGQMFSFRVLYIERKWIADSWNMPENCKKISRKKTHTYVFALFAILFASQV